MSDNPAIPRFILRGHTSPVHSLCFLHQNAYLVSGDSVGWLIIWGTTSKRAVAVWKAHEGGVTGIKSWNETRLITHGRDHKLRVWKIDLGRDTTLDTKLPAEGASEDQAKPWLLHSMDMSALNFCTFAVCYEHATESADDTSIFIASPNALDNGGIDVFRLPNEQRIAQIPATKGDKTGMVMSLAMFLSAKDHLLCIIAGYEDGRVMLHHEKGGNWRTIVDQKTHSQPVLSLALSADRMFYITSSADDIIAQQPVPSLEVSSTRSDEKPRIINTKHAGQQGLSLRSDDKIFATAGWDSRVRVYSCKSLKELAVLKWHKEGCYSTAFASLASNDETEKETEPIMAITRTTTALDRLKQERELKARQTHWLAAGGKDGKISLWDIY